MGLNGLDLTSETTLFIDTAPLIYFFEEHPDHIESLSLFFDAVTESGARLVTSMITYIEVLVHPERAGEGILAAKYRNFLTNSEQISLYPLNLPVADACAKLRAQHKLKTPDAIQLAVAATCGADIVLTNDAAWKTVPGFRVILVTELKDCE
ncbi:MAG: putative nucleic acid-binding protein [Kiritimatiellia bacterium]